MKQVFQSLFLLSTFCLILFTSCKDQANTNQDNSSTQSENPSLKTGPLNQEEQAHYLSLGKSMAESTFQVMSANLKEALANGGVQEAISYCNVVALKITDSLSVANDATIKRTSLKLRNQENKPSEDELDILNKYTSSLEKKLEIDPFVVPFGDDSVKFYAPIYAKDLCLTCHGIVNETLQQNDLDFITELYPDDMAIGYKNGDLRGIWSIKMLRNW